MKNKEMYNKEGYRDETAGKAIGNMTVEVVRGDVWEVSRSDGFTECVVILGVNEKYASTTKIVDVEPYENAVNVVCRGKRYIDAGKLGFTYYDKFKDFIRALTDEEMEMLEKKIVEAIGIEMAAEKTLPSDWMDAAVLEERDQIKKELVYWKEKNGKAEEELHKLENELEKKEMIINEMRSKTANNETETLAILKIHMAAAQTEAAIYKAEYERVLQELVGGK